MSTTADTSHASSFSIRSVRQDDAERVFELLKQLAESYAPDRAAFDDAFAFLSEDNASSVFLGAQDASGLLIGYALTTVTPLLYTNGRSAQLQELVVDDAHQGVGVGTALVEALEAICRERQVKQLTVPSRRSADFYERLGYRSTADFLKRTFD